MHDDLVQLRDMDTHDRAADRARREAEKLRQARRDAEGVIDAARAEVARIEGEQAALKKAEHATQRGLEQARTYRSRAERALQQGLGDADAAQRQLESTSDQIDELETQMLEHMEAADSLAAARAAAEVAVEKAVEAHATLMKTWASELATQEQRAADESARLQELAAGVPADLRDRYESHRAKRRWAVAVIREGACNACNKVVRQQHISDLRRGLLKPCLGCNRFLVLAEG